MLSCQILKIYFCYYTVNEINKKIKLINNIFKINYLFLFYLFVHTMFFYILTTIKLIELFILNM